MKILLLNPPYYDVYKGFKSAAKLGASYPPTGLLYIAAAVLQAGHEVELVDVDVEGLCVDDVVQQVKASRAQAVAVTATTPTFVNAAALLTEIKKACDVTTILGGIHVTIMMDSVLKETPQLDLAVYGEGELTFVELLDCLESGQPLGEIRGLMYRDDEQVKVNPPRPFIENLDILPFPARQLSKKDCYRWSVPGRGEQQIALILTKRGCPFHCRFCSAHSMFGKNVRFRSVTNIADELEQIVTRDGISHVLFGDDTLVLKRERMKELCDQIKQRGLKFTWEGMARANVIDKEILQDMSDAGLRRISFGIESGDQEILQLEHKGITLEQIRQAYRWAKECGLETRGSAIIGHPGETRQSAWRTIKFLRSLRDLDQAYLNVMVPYPGTEVYEIAKAGQHGMRLLCDDFKEFTRYANSVIEVNDLSKQDLMRLQKIGILYFYLTPRRIWYNLRRAGLKAGLKNMVAFVKGIVNQS